MVMKHYTDIDITLEIDDEQLNTRATGLPLLDEKIKLLLTRENRILLSEASISNHTDTDANRTLSEIVFQMDAMIAQKCRLEQMILTVTFNESSHCKVEDMAPTSVLGKDPIKQKVGYKGGLKFEIGHLKIGPSAEIEKSEEKNVYYPEITAHGVPYNFASWHFRGEASKILDIQKEFRILLTRDSMPKELSVEYRLEADIRYDKLPGYIPLIGRKSVEFMVTEELS